nr:hypothetical protein [Actinopolyspora halophila]
MGRHPTRKVDTPISSRVATSTFFRPSRSPTWPRNSAPNGPATYPTPKVANESRVPVTGSAAGKKIFWKTSAAAVP